MYNEENETKNYFFRNLIVKILLVLLFVFLLMWLFPMPNLSPFYDRIFKENIDTMTEAAKNYYTTSRLPQKEDETKSITLKEMLDNKMVISFTDSDGKACDVNKSYVEVTKKDGEYIFKTYLSCDSQEDYVVTYEGCRDLCEDSSCEEEDTEEIIEYQFYKITKEKVVDKYVCKEGYALSGKKCVLKTNIKEEKDAELTCKKGYTYNEDNNKCEKIIIEKTDAQKSCPTGYDYSSTTDKCTKNTTTTEDAKVTYKCSGNSIPVNGKCPVTIRTEVLAEKVYNCPTGYNLSDDKTKCILEKALSVAYACAGGVTPINGKCPVTTYSGCKEEAVCTYKQYSCDSTSLPTVITKAQNPNYTVTVVSVNRCIITYAFCNYVKIGCSVPTTTYVDATKSYYCAEGNRVGDKCVLEAVPTISYSCPIGTLSVDGDTCLIPSTIELDAVKIYSCDTGTLNGDKCELSSTDTKDYSLYCNIGTLKDGKCVIKTTDRKDPVYACGCDYTQVGDKCYKFSTITKIEDATKIYKTISTKVYKWSRSKTLEGWTFTGKTRTVTVTVK